MQNIFSQLFSRRIILSIFIASFVLTFAATANAFVTPLAFSVIPPIQFPPSQFSIAGVRASALWGSHRDVYGIDIGVLGNITMESMVGISVAGGFNITHGTTNAIGLQAAGLTNVNTNKTSVYGVQLAGLVNANTATSTVVGLQLAAIANLAEFTTIYGFQVGLYNRAQDVYGIQIGLVNIATNLHGIQIGLANFNQKGLVSVAPFLNIGF